MWSWTAATLLVLFAYAQSAPVSTSNNQVQMQKSAVNTRSKRFAHDIYGYLASYQQAYNLDSPEEGTVQLTPQKRFSDLVNYLHMYQQEAPVPVAAYVDKKDEPDVLPSAPIGWNLLNLNSFDNE